MNSEIIAFYSIHFQNIWVLPMECTKVIFSEHFPANKIFFYLILILTFNTPPFSCFILFDEIIQFTLWNQIQVTFDNKILMQYLYVSNLGNNKEHWSFVIIRKKVFVWNCLVVFFYNRLLRYAYQFSSF